jgi:hypothetical protein
MANNWRDRDTDYQLFVERMEWMSGRISHR